ncbi:uncharacterized protein [Procambarus clarkii]|uniref:uncharacterized protein n=1 Tax=Procambarus clarkii TaxID=6728 RepID=UPI003743C3A1
MVFSLEGWLYQPALQAEKASRLKKVTELQVTELQVTELVGGSTYIPIEDALLMKRRRNKISRSCSAISRGVSSALWAPGFGNNTDGMSAETRWLVAGMDVDVDAISEGTVLVADIAGVDTDVDVVTEGMVSNLQSSRGSNRKALQMRKEAAAIRKEVLEREAALAKEALQIREREAAIRKQQQERETALLRQRERVQLEAKQRHLAIQRDHDKKQAETAIAYRQQELANRRPTILPMGKNEGRNNCKSGNRELPLREMGQERTASLAAAASRRSFKETNMAGDPAKLNQLKFTGNKKQPILNLNNNRMDRIKGTESHEYTESTTTKENCKRESKRQSIENSIKFRCENASLMRKATLSAEKTPEGRLKKTIEGYQKKGSALNTILGHTLVLLKRSRVWYQVSPEKNDERGNFRERVMQVSNYQKKAPNRESYVAPANVRNNQKALNITKDANTRTETHKSNDIKSIRFVKNPIEGQATARDNRKARHARRPGSQDIQQGYARPYEGQCNLEQVMQEIVLCLALR